MNKYTVGARVFCDFLFGGKPKAKVIQIVKPGNGKNINGLVLVQLTETRGPWKKGENLELGTFNCIPVEQEFRKNGSYFRWVNTDYCFE